MRHGVRMPYSQRALEGLSMALQVNSSAIWFDPVKGRVDVKSFGSEEECEEKEDEEDLSVLY